MRIVYFCITLTVVLFVLGLAGESDLRDQEETEEQYCNNVGAGAWPDYRGNYSTMCRVAKAGGFSHEN